MGGGGLHHEKQEGKKSIVKILKSKLKSKSKEKVFFLKFEPQIGLIATEVSP